MFPRTTILVAILSGENEIILSNLSVHIDGAYAGKSKQA